MSRVGRKSLMLTAAVAAAWLLAAVPAYAGGRGHSKHGDSGHGYSRHGHSGHGYSHHKHYTGCGHGSHDHGPRVVYGFSYYAPPPVAYHYAPPVVYGYPYPPPPAPVGYYCGHCRYHAGALPAFQNHVAVVHDLGWNQVSAALAWNPSKNLYVFGRVNF